MTTQSNKGNCVVNNALTSQLVWKYADTARASSLLTDDGRGTMQGNEMVDFQFLAENSVDVICRGGLDRVLHYVSPSSLLILGWEPREMIGRKIDDFVLAEDFPLVTSAIARSLSSGIHNDSVTLRMKKKDGSTVWMEVNSRIIRDLETEEVREFIVAMRDVSDRKLREEKLSALALTDGLTGFPIAGPLTKH